MKSKKIQVVLTCEHAGNELLPYLEKLNSVNVIKYLKSLKKTHRAYDIGAYFLLQNLEENMMFPCQSFAFFRSRLLIDANRSYEKCMSKKIQKNLEEDFLIQLINEYQLYRQSVIKFVQKKIKQGHIVFLFSIHSFTPVFKGKLRKNDLGVLYRTYLEKESGLADKFIKNFKKTSLDIKIYRNLPYRGYTDGFSNDIIDQFSQAPLHGLFLEVNQRWLTQKKPFKKLSEILCATINETILDYGK